MTSWKRPPTTQENVNLRPSVYGLDLGRSQARHSQRRQRHRTLAVRFAVMIVALAGVTGAGLFTYATYIDHETDEQLESDRRVAELERQRAGRTTEDIIAELERVPAWNGPGNPTFGVGSNNP